MDFKKYLNNEQYEVVVNGDGHCLVLAGAGSGKTRTLTFRTAYLLHKKIRPENILLMTFTNKAANEMIERIYQILGYKPYNLWAGTFHRIGNLILRKYANLLGFDANFIILDTQDSKNLIKACYKELNIDLKGNDFPKPNVIQSMISFAENSCIDFDELLCAKYNFPSFFLDKVIEIANLYKKKKKQLNAMDFDDLLGKWLFLLENFDNIQEILSGKFEYILVDEYQDTNKIQAQIIKLLSLKHKNVLAVGDDSQSIYSFRAADISHILNFEKDFENTKVFRLETNYRSTPEILELANQSIGYNTSQYQKILKSVQDPGQKPVFVIVKNVFEQADYVVKKIKQDLDNGLSLSDIAVLFRAGHMSIDLQLALSKNNIPFIVRSGLKYFEQAHIKDVISILRVWHNLQDELSWVRFLTLFPGIGEKSALKIFKEIVRARSLEEFVKLNLTKSFRQKNSLEQIKSILQYLVDLSDDEKIDISAGIKYIYQSFYKNYLKNTYEDANSRMEDIGALIDFANNYSDLESFLSDISLDESIAYSQEENSEKLVLSTIHQAKGLEWEHVFILGLRDGSFPHFKSKESFVELEEERRLFYVAVTRAKKFLHLIYPVNMHSYEYGEISSEPSLFIQELDQDCYEVENYLSNNGYLGSYDLIADNFEENDYEKKNKFWSPGQDFFSDSGIDPEYEDNIIEYD